MFGLITNVPVWDIKMSSTQQGKRQICRYGDLCRYWKQGTCNYWHPPEEVKPTLVNPPVKSVKDVMKGKIEEALTFIEKLTDEERKKTSGLGAPYTNTRRTTTKKYEKLKTACYKRAEQVQSIGKNFRESVKKIKGNDDLVLLECNRVKSNLPIYAEREEIFSKYATSRVIIVTGDTGTGKSTQLPQYLVDFGYVNKKIMVTQPTSLSAISLAERIAKERGRHGDIVGYKLNDFQSKCDDRTKIIFATEDILLEEITNDNLLSSYSCIIIDEAHERTLLLDLLFALLKIVLTKNASLKLILSSATMNEKLFKKFFNYCPVIPIKKFNYDVDVEYLTTPLDVLSMAQYYDCIGDKVIKYLKKAQNEPGDILIFLPSKGDCEKLKIKLKQLLRQFTRPRNKTDTNKPAPEYPGWKVYTFHQDTNEKVRDQVLSGPSQSPTTGKFRRKIILSTNILETSFTIEGITCVIDTGLNDEIIYDYENDCALSAYQYITKSSAKQRKGRTGRTCPGICYRLYTNLQKAQMQSFPTGEVQRKDLSSFYLSLLQYFPFHHIRSLEEFKLHGCFLQKPSEEFEKKALNILFNLQAATVLNGKDVVLTGMGMKMANISFPCRYSRMLIESMSSFNSSYSHCLHLFAILSVSEHIFDKKAKVDNVAKINSQFNYPSNDPLNYLHLFYQYLRIEYDDDMEQIIQRELWCKEYSIDPSVLLLAERNYLRYKRMFLALLEYCHKHKTSQDTPNAANQAIPPLLPFMVVSEASTIPKPQFTPTNQNTSIYFDAPISNANNGGHTVTQKYNLSPRSPGKGEKMAVIGSSLLPELSLKTSGMIVNNDLAKSIDSIYWVRNEIRGDLLDRERKVRARHNCSKKSIAQRLAYAKLDDKWKVPKTILDYLTEDEIDRLKKLIFLGFFLNVGKLVRKPSECETRGNEEDNVIEYLLVNENKLYQLHLKSSFNQTKQNPPDYIITFKKLHLRATKDYIFNISDIQFAWIKERYESLRSINNVFCNTNFQKFIQLEERRLAGEIVMNRQDIILPVGDSLIRQFLKGNGQKRIELQNRLNANIDFIDKYLKKIKVSPLSDDCFFISALSTTDSQFVDLMSSQKTQTLQEKLKKKINKLSSKCKNKVEVIVANYNRFLVGRGGKIIKKLCDDEFINIRLKNFPINYPMSTIRQYLKDQVKVLPYQRETVEDLDDSLEIMAVKNDYEETKCIFIKFNSVPLAADYIKIHPVFSLPNTSHQITSEVFQPSSHETKVLRRSNSTSLNTILREAKTLKVYWKPPSDGKCSLFFYKPLDHQQLTECLHYISQCLYQPPSKGKIRSNDCIVFEKLENFSDVDVRQRLYQNGRCPPEPIKSIIMSNSLLDQNCDFSAIKDNLKQNFTEFKPQIILSKSPSAKIEFTTQEQAIEAYKKIVPQKLKMSQFSSSLQVEFYLKEIIYFPHKLFYKVFKNRVDGYLNNLPYHYSEFFFELSTTNDYSALVMKPREFLSTYELFRMWSEKLLLVKDRVVSQLLHSKKLPEVFYKYFSSESAFLKQIGNNAGCFIFIDKEHSNIVVYGDEGNIQKVFQEIERKVQAEQLHMGSFPLDPSTAGAFFALWRKELRAFCAKKFPNTKIEIDYTSQLLFSCGSKMEVENLRVFITKTLQNLPSVTAGPQSEDDAECVLCFCDASADEKGFTLLCKHWIHQDCLRQMVINSPENLACLSCNKLICLDDLLFNGFFLSNDIENMKEKWVDVFIKHNKDKYRYCPMDNGCSAICEISSSPCYTECPNGKCHGSFCGKCFKPYHGKTECNDKGTDYSAIMNSNPNFKQCPHCKIPQERFIGCNAVQCPYCGGHWCYRCGIGFSDDAHKHFKDPTVDCFRKLFD